MGLEKIIQHLPVTVVQGIHLSRVSSSLSKFSIRMYEWSSLSPSIVNGTAMVNEVVGIIALFFIRRPTSRYNVWFLIFFFSASKKNYKNRHRKNYFQ